MLVVVPSAHAKKISSPAQTLTPRAGQIESNYDETTDSFDAMNLKAELLRGVYAYGFERPSAIQQRAIMPVIKGECNPPPPPVARRRLTYTYRSRCDCAGPVRYR